MNIRRKSEFSVWNGAVWPNELRRTKKARGGIIRALTISEAKSRVLDFRRPLDINRTFFLT
jgi:hypothetical protein